MKSRQRGYIGVGARRGVGGGIQPAVLTLELPFADAGAGIATITLNKGTGSATFTRATVAWTRLSTGLWASVASGQPRSLYDSDGTYLGYFCEGARTNLCLQSDDLTDAAWTKTTMTTAKTATGADGAANTATTLTATAGNATALQAITDASATRVVGCFIKRRTGTGTIQLTMDNGSTWTAVTVTSAWLPVEIPGQTLANPTVGIRIVTNADAVDVMWFQCETVAALTNKMSSPLPTTAASFTRNIDSLTVPQAGNGVSDKASTVYAEATCFNRGSVAAVFGGGSSTPCPLGKGSANNDPYVSDGANQPSTGTTPWTNNAPHRIASTWGPSGLNIAFDGTVGVRTPYDGTILPATSIFIGLGIASQFALFGTIKNFRIYNGAMNDGQIAIFTTPDNLIVPTQLTDAAPFQNKGAYDYSEMSGQIVLTTNADALVIDAFNNLAADQYLGVYVDGAYNQVLAVGTGATTRTVFGLGKVAKTVAITNGPQQRVNGALDAIQQGTFLKRIGCHTHSITRTTPSTTGRVAILGDSIANGYAGSPLMQKGWAQQIRISKYPLSICVVGSGSETLMQVASTAPLVAITVATIVALNPAKLWIALGTNDYGFGSLTAPAFQTAYAALLDALHAAIPGLSIWAASPIIRTFGSGEAANPTYTLGDFRTATSNACVGRAWATYVDGNAIMLAGDLSDGIHPANTGHDKYAAAAITAMGL